MADLDALAAELWGRQHEAEDALVHGDVGPRLAMWSHTEPVTLFAALGPSKSGWAKLEPMFRAVASRLSKGHDGRPARSAISSPISSSVPVRSSSMAAIEEPFPIGRSEGRQDHRGTRAIERPDVPSDRRHARPLRRSPRPANR